MYYHPSMGQLPKAGTLIVDFVSPFHVPPESKTLSVVQFRDWKKEHLAADKTPEQQLLSIRLCSKWDLTM